MRFSVVVFYKYQAIIWVFFICFLSLFNPLRINPLNISSNINHQKSLEKENSIQLSNKTETTPKFNEIKFYDSPIPYEIEQYTQKHVKTSHQKYLNTTSNTNVSIEAEIINSSFNIISDAENGDNEWINDIEPNYGTVNVTKIPTKTNAFFQLNFTENNQTPASGISNAKFILNSTPDPTSYSTNVSFDFQIPSLSSGLINSPHTLALEFRFNNASIYFILSDFGSNLGEFLEENLTRPIGSDSLYILCNETVPLNWRRISYNITRLITTYFSPVELSKFSQLETLFCYMFAFTPNYHLTLGLDNLTYISMLPSNYSIIYSIGTTNITTNNGKLRFNSTLGNFTFCANENSPWNNSLQSYINLSLIRKTETEGVQIITNWNETSVKIRLDLEVPDLMDNISLSSYIHIFLPSDWTEIAIVNHSSSVELLKLLYDTKIFNEFIIGRHYTINMSNYDFVYVEAWGPNYFSNIVTPTDIRWNQIIEIRGDLKYSLPGHISLFIHNNYSFVYHQTTLPMINSTFVFFNLKISEQFPLGILKLTLNWSNSLENGIYEKIIYIHEDINSESMILFHTPKNIEIFQYEQVLINLSLLRNGEKYVSKKTLVLLLKGNEYFSFSQSLTTDYILNISHILWFPGEYSLEIVASDGSEFFATDKVNLSVQAALVTWTFENLKSSLIRNENISFRIYSYLQPQDGNFYILSGLEIKIWINDTLKAECRTNLEGFVDISFDIEDINLGNWLYVSLVGNLEGKILKYDTLMFSFSNETILNDRERVNLQEITKSIVKANKTFFVYFSIDYPNNNSNWYIPIESISQNIRSAYILRDNFIIGTQIYTQYIIWNLKANQTINDVLILELLSPTIYVDKKEISKEFRMQIIVTSQIMIQNFSLQIDLGFFDFFLTNLSLFDSLNRDITLLFPLTIKGSTITISNINIISGIEVTYFLEGYIQEVKIEVFKPFKLVYFYNESISGSWIVSRTMNFTFTVEYSLLNGGTRFSQNNSLMSLSNGSMVISTTLPPQRWNSSISIQLFVEYSTKLREESTVQNCTIIDPFVPILSYSIEYFNNNITVHTFAYEPEKASGVKNVSVQTQNQIFGFSSIKNYHYVFEIPQNVVDHQYILIEVEDFAGNVALSDFIEIDRISTSSSAFFGVFNSQSIFSVFLSAAIISGIIITRQIKKQKTSFL